MLVSHEATSEGSLGQKGLIQLYPFYPMAVVLTFLMLLLAQPLPSTAQ